MRQLIALTIRDLKAFWYSPLAYVIGAVFFLLQGFVFRLLIQVLSDPRADGSWSMAQLMFNGFFYWICLLVTTPALTMRTFSEEKRTGTIELLLTAPVTETQIVLAKFLGAWLTYVALWGSTIVFFLFLRTLTPFDWGPVVTGYLGTWLIGTVFIAVGVLASSLTRNQPIALMISFVALLLFFAIGLLAIFVRDPESSRIVQHLSLIEHLHDFSRGVIDTRPVILYLTLTAIALFATGRAISSPRWRT